VCHVDRFTGDEDINIDFCPLTTVTTDLFGDINVDIRVSDRTWNSTTEYFIITPSKVDTLMDGTVIEHVFSPATQSVSLHHLMSGMKIKFTDNTTVSIFGKVAFDPANTAFNDCPFPGVPVALLDAYGQETIHVTDSDGLFSFSVDKGTAASVYIPDYKNYQWSSMIDSQNTLEDEEETQR